MSTDESDSITSSQIRRFGLYRTIDAKTEEFLRLSRKRQMRQGCACAAISTTITVTVVVSFILIYEYSMISESTPRTTLTPNWLNLMNSSVDDLPFDVKLDKAKTGHDPATIKYLPIILKTLKKHKYFDKIIDEPSSPNPLQDIREPTEYVSNKNIFSDTRNWMRIPSRLYTIEYKTSPIVYFKNPTRNIDYFKKVRKIRDYQRIMNYVDKMISERVTFGSTQPMAKNIYNIHKNSMTDLTTPMTKADTYEVNTQKPHIKKTRLKSADEKRHCNCPKKINEILNKIISSLHSLFPNTNAKINSTPSETNTLKPHVKSTTKHYHTTQSVPKTSTVPHRRQRITTPLPKIDYTLNAIIALLRPNIIQKSVNKTNMNMLKKVSNENNVERMKFNYNLENTTKNMENIGKMEIPDSAITIRDFIFKSSSLQTTEPFATFSTITDNEYEDYADARPNSNVLDTNDLEFVENNVSNKHVRNFNNGVGRTMACNDREKGNNVILKNMSERIVSPTVSALTESNINWRTSEKTQYMGMTEITTRTTPIPRKEYQEKIKKYTTSSSSSQVTIKSEKQQQQLEQVLKYDDITLEDELEKSISDDLTPEEDIKNLENIIRTLNHSNTYNETTTENSDLYEWEIIKIGDKYDEIEDIKSMIPQDRASYLEIHRSEWKQDERQDYDNNINQYLFE